MDRSISRMFSLLSQNISVFQKARREFVFMFSLDTKSYKYETLSMCPRAALHCNTQMRD